MTSYYNGGGYMIPDWERERRRMVEKQLRARRIRDQRVLQAMLEIPRQEFVPDEARLFSYEDEPIRIGFGQTISQPYMAALMAECLELKGHENVLEVGAGSGYFAAILGVLAARVISIELIPELAEMARRNLEKTGRAANITVVCGDGSQGYPEAAPYDGISVAAAAPGVPHALVEQLRDPGILVIPVGEMEDQSLEVIRKEQGRVDKRVAAFCRFVPLRGDQGWK